MQLLSISTGKSDNLFYGSGERAQSTQSAIRKTVVSELSHPVAIQVRPLGLDNDEQNDLSVHGGLDKAVYLFPVEHYEFWNTVSQQAGQKVPLAHGKMGENLTISGLTERNAFVGDQLMIGTVVLRVESPRIPCFKFSAAMGFKHATAMMVQSGFCGFYCSVIQPGFLTAGDKMTIQSGEQVLSIEQRFAMTTRGRQRDLF